MKINTLLELINKHNIPDDVLLQSDSDWECGATDTDGVYYNKKLNVIVFTQSVNVSDYYFINSDWKISE